MIDYISLAKKYAQKLSPIKLLLFDVDGILTDGRVFYASEEVGWNRFFHIHDGYGIKLMQGMGYKVGIITGGDSLGMHKRFNMLGVDFIYAGSENKTPAFEEILKKTSLSEKEILYMGDDLFDLPLLERVGFSATVPTAPFELLESVHYVTAKQAGMGCAREVMEFIRLGKNKKIFS